MDPRRLNRLLIGPPFLFLYRAQRDTSIWNSKVRVACCALRTLSRTTTLVAHNSAKCEYTSPL